MQLLTTFNNNLAIGSGNVNNVVIGSNGVNRSINGKGANIQPCGIFLSVIRKLPKGRNRKTQKLGRVPM